VKGEIKAKSILIGEKMDGNVRAQELVEIESKGKVLEDSFTPPIGLKCLLYGIQIMVL
jgi:cytoskeletal protein CcmA (bactofilin family)